MITIDPNNPGHAVKTANTETYAIFRSNIPKPTEEDKHIRHILRFYIARAMQKRGLEEIYVLPNLEINGMSISVDVIGKSENKHILAICEPESVTPETEAVLDALKDLSEIEVIVVHSRYGDSGNVMEKFKDQLESKKFRLLAVVPPPFDDVYEYDIWMFETTFRDLFTEEG